MMKERKTETTETGNNNRTTETGNNNRTETNNNDTWLVTASKQVNNCANILFKQ